MYGVWSVHVLVVLYLVAFLFLLLHVRRRFTAPQRISQFFQVRTWGSFKDFKKVSNFVLRSVLRWRYIWIKDSVRRARRRGRTRVADKSTLLSISFLSRGVHGLPQSFSNWEWGYPPPSSPHSASR